MTLKTNTGKYLKYFTSNKTPIKGTKKGLPWRVSQSNSKEGDLSKTFSEESTNQISYIDLESVPK